MFKKWRHSAFITESCVVTRNIVQHAQKGFSTPEPCGSPMSEWVIEKNYEKEPKTKGIGGAYTHNDDIYSLAMIEGINEEEKLAGQIERLVFSGWPEGQGIYHRLLELTSTRYELTKRHGGYSLAVNKYIALQLLKHTLGLKNELDTLRTREVKQHRNFRFSTIQNILRDIIAHMQAVQKKPCIPLAVYTDKDSNSEAQAANYLIDNPSPKVIEDHNSKWENYLFLMEAKMQRDLSSQNHHIVLLGERLAAIQKHEEDMKLSKKPKDMYTLHDYKKLKKNHSLRHRILKDAELENEQIIHTIETIWSDSTDVPRQDLDIESFLIRLKQEDHIIDGSCSFRSVDGIRLAWNINLSMLAIIGMGKSNYSAALSAAKRAGRVKWENSEVCQYFLENFGCQFSVEPPEQLPWS